MDVRRGDLSLLGQRKASVRPLSRPSSTPGPCSVHKPVTVLGQPLRPTPNTEREAIVNERLIATPGNIPLKSGYGKSSTLVRSGQMHTISSDISLRSKRSVFPINDGGFIHNSDSFKDDDDVDAGDDAGDDSDDEDDDDAAEEDDDDAAEDDDDAAEDDDAADEDDDAADDDDDDDPTDNDDDAEDDVGAKNDSDTDDNEMEDPKSYRENLREGLTRNGQDNTSTLSKVEQPDIAPLSDRLDPLKRHFDSKRKFSKLHHTISEDRTGTQVDVLMSRLVYLTLHMGTVQTTQSQAIVPFSACPSIRPPPLQPRHGAQRFIHDAITYINFLKDVGEIDQGKALHDINRLKDFDTMDSIGFDNVEIGENIDDVEIGENIDYVALVKAHFSDDLDKYNHFVDILREKTRVGFLGTVVRIVDLFDGNPTLIYGFNIFFPPGCRIKKETDCNRDVFRVFTPSRTILIERII